MARQRLYIVQGHGHDAVGLVGTITAPIGKAGGSIVDLRQDVLHGLSTLYMVVDLSDTELRLEDLSAMVKDLAEDTGLELSVQKYLPVLVSINLFLGDPDEDLLDIQRACRAAGVEALVTDYRESGGAGGTELANKVCELCEQPSELEFQYPLDASIVDKITAISQKIYVVVYPGDVVTMPGLAKQPAALKIDVDDAGTISGLF